MQCSGLSDRPFVASGARVVEGKSGIKSEKVKDKAEAKLTSVRF